MTNLGPQERLSRCEFERTNSSSIASSAVSMASLWDGCIVTVRRLSRYLSCFLLVATASSGALSISGTTAGRSPAASPTASPSGPPRPTYLKRSFLVKTELSILLALSKSKFVVTVAAGTTVTAESGPVVATGLSVNWAWSASEGLEVVVTEADAHSEASVGSLLASVALLSVSVALSVSDVVGEDVELMVHDGSVPSVHVLNNNSSGNIESLEPVKSHGVENLVNWLGFLERGVNSALNELSLSVEGLNSIIVVIIDAAVPGEALIISSSNQILVVLVGSVSGKSACGGDILKLTGEEVELELEWSLDLEEVILVDLHQTVESLIKHSLDVVKSGGVCQINLGGSISNELTNLVGDDGPGTVSEWEHGIVTIDMGSSLVLSVGVALASLWHAWHGLVTELLSVGVTMAIRVADVVAEAEGALEGSISVSTVGIHLSESR